MSGWVRVIALIATGLFLVGCGERSAPVSIVHLLTNPREYRGDRVIVSGFLREHSGFLHLYLTEEYALMFSEASSILVHDASQDRSLIKNSACNEGYVEIIGTFGVIEHVDLFGIMKVERVTRFDFSKTEKRRKTCWQAEK
jgi:hypothetical protein